MNETIRGRLAAICARWDAVEKRMKAVELIRGETVIAAVNELRYTGRRIADALQLVASPDFDLVKEVKVQEHLLHAENYLVNADHDLTDAVVLFVSVRLKRVLQVHKLEVVRALVPDFDKKYQKLDHARSVVIASRGQRDKRIDIYDALAADVPTLVDLHDALVSKPELRVPDDDVKRGVQLVSIAACVGALAAFGTFIFHAWGWYHYQPPLTAEEIKAAVIEALKERQ